MNLLRPKKIIISGFRSFREKSEINFPDQGSVLINGRHKDGTTESGSGKSSILIAMYYALGYCDIPQTELKNWYSKSMYVELTLTDGVNTYVIIRDPKLKLIQNGVPYEGTSEGAAEILQTILKISPELVTALTYRPQREIGKFINQTDAEGKEFLSVLLNLTQIEQTNDQLSCELNAVLDKTRALSSDINNSKNYLEATSISQEAYLAAKEALDKATIAVAKLSTNEEELNNLTNQIIEIDNAQLQINKVNYDTSMAKNEITAIRNKISQLQAESTTLKANICHTCKREWDKSADLLVLKQNEVKQLIETMKVKLVLVKNSEPMLSPDYQESIKCRKNELTSALVNLKAPIAGAHSLKNLAQTNFNTLQNAIDAANRIKADLVTKENTLKDLAIDEYLLKHSVDITSRTGFLAEIFDEVLQDITRRSNDIMSFIPNINTFTLNVSSNTITQKGKVNKKIEKSINKDNRKIPIKSISGGQKTSVELASDLAMAEAIRARSGSPLGWVAMDEAMDGLGVSTKMAVLDVIKSKVNGLIIVVDHSTEIKEAFDSVINIEFDGRDSYVS